MADRSFGFLSGYPVEFFKIGTKNGPSLDRDDKNVPLLNETNINIYRQMGTDRIVRAMQDLTQIKFVDQLVSNTYIQAGMAGPVLGWHAQIFSPVSRGIATTLIKNSQGGVTLRQALQNIYEAVVPRGLKRHFPIAPAPTTFNINAKPPPGFRKLIQTQITAPPIVPPTIRFRKEYEGFNAAYGFDYDSPPAPDVPDSNYGNEYPSKEITQGTGGTKPAPESIIGECFDTFIEAVDGKVTLNHIGISTSGNPISTTDVVIVTV